MISILAGSSRKNSNTEKVAKAIERILIENGIDSSQISRPDFTQYDFPFMNGGGVNPDSLTEFQSSVIAGMLNAKLIFILSPEYNWFPSAEIINLVNHVGSKTYANCWDKKVFATCGISSGRGGRIPAVQLSYLINKIINVMNFRSTVSAKMFESQFTPDALDEHGNSKGNAEYDKGLQQFVTYNLEFVQ